MSVLIPFAITAVCVVAILFLGPCEIAWLTKLTRGD